MKKIVGFIIVISLMVGEIIILNNDITSIIKSNEKIEEDIKAIEGVEQLKEEKNSLNTELQSLLTMETFSEEDIKQIMNTENTISKDLEEDITSLENQIINLEDKLNNLQKEYYKLVKENEEKNSFYISNVPFINQYPNYPTGCESVALTILLNYYGVAVTPDDIIAKLPKGDVPTQKNGKMYGGNPEKEFVGNPYSLNAYGVYEKPIAEVANQYKSGIKIATGTEFSKILEIVKTGRPVLVWTSMNLSVSYISKSWIYEPTGETIYWKANEHAVVIIGYTEDKVIISDPINGKVKYQSKTIFNERYNYYGKKALYY